ncbi:MAG: hypothetical protein PUH10_01665 [Erysipelotrichaceae bacterium]|uniref:hypothetical protein n=1 Tax=Floccifex sp. TaxID=2815810 RepID=UPI002A74B67B|nr:hypothetical protein [Floccifex sp.]MDD7280697.1 hypothetical protein [Erysipelotrichaceae bacterium]MDY2957702.1 hypothetical protein [Floccifex sp.]
MRIAYLVLYTEKNFEEITENLDKILDAGDDAYVMINDADLRDEVFLAYADEPRLHVSTKQDSALPADLSTPRGFICQIEEALDYEQQDDFQYDYFITLTDGMLPLIHKEQMDAFLKELNHKDCYYEITNSNENKELQERLEQYAFFTNSYDFQKSKIIRGMNNMTSNIVTKFKKRDIEDTVYLTYPWFILTHESATALADNKAYCTTNFMMCQYPEELVFGTMLHKFSNVEHVNKDVWLIGETNSYLLMSPVKPVTMDQIINNKDKIFAGKIHSGTNLDVYQNTFDIYWPITEEDIEDYNQQH